MKKTTLLTTFIALSSLLFMTINAQNSMKPTEEAIRNLKPYPAAVDTLVRHVIYVEQKENEDLFEVELIPGKTLEVDCNRHRLMGTFEEETVSGWGYTYYKFESEGQVLSTMMACHEPKASKFVSGEGLNVRYNSRLPIVVYLPKDMELKYRIWTAGEEQSATAK